MQLNFPAFQIVDMIFLLHRSGLGAHDLPLSVVGEREKGRELGDLVALGTTIRPINLEAPIPSQFKFSR